MHPESIRKLAIVIATSSRTREYAHAVGKADAATTVYRDDVDRFCEEQKRYVAWLEGVIARQLEATRLER